MELKTIIKNIIQPKLMTPQWVYFAAVGIHMLGSETAKRYSWLLLILALGENYLRSEDAHGYLSTAGRWVSNVLRALWVIGFILSFHS